MNQQEFFKRYSYDIRTDRIGGGSFGNVYKAHDNVHHEDVAVKVAEVQHFGNKEFSLKIELDTVKSMPDHPNIALYKEVYQFEMPNGIFDFAIMKYYPHGNLKNILSEHSLSQAQKESIARQLIAGVAHLHQNGVLHRDLKPANILIHQQGNNYFPLIADFGLSKLSQSEGSRISNSFGGGTLEYSAPEQLLGKTLRYNADLWALGVIVYELFTGKRPFVTDNTNSSAEAKRQEIFNKIVNAPLPKDVENLPTPFNTFVANCLEKDPEIRAKTTAEALEKIATKGQGQPFGEAQNEETEVQKTPPKPPDPSKPQSNWWLLVLGLFVVAGAYYFFSGNTNIIAQLEKNMVYVAGGSFTMGCTSEQGSDCYDNEKPAHPVSVKSFYIGKYEVTQAEWRAVMGSDPEELYFKGCDRCPVENVSWEDVQDFLKKLNAQTGKNYRLPSEAEWEYAARGGNKSKGYKYAGSNNIDEVAWYGYEKAGKETHAVGGKQANELGLYDMSGNVYEWCNDWYKGYPGSSGVTDYTGSRREGRGGSWNGAASFCRVSCRDESGPDSRLGFLGFRLAVY